MPGKTMKTLLNISVLTFLLVVAASPCLALMGIENVSPARAKELGMEIRAKAAGPDSVWVELEFDTKGDLKSFDRVDLEIWDGKKLLLSTSLKERQPTPGRVVVSFTADRAHLDKMTLSVVTGFPTNYTGHDLRVKYFADLEKVR